MKDSFLYVSAFRSLDYGYNMFWISLYFSKWGYTVLYFFTWSAYLNFSEYNFKEKFSTYSTYLILWAMLSEAHALFLFGLNNWDRYVDRTSKNKVLKIITKHEMQLVIVRQIVLAVMAVHGNPNGNSRRLAVFRVGGCTYTQICELRIKNCCT
jgi:hypothetical protein